MKVIKKETIYTNKGNFALNRYELDSGHTAHIYAPDDFFIYTKSGNYATQITARKVLFSINLHNCQFPQPIETVEA
jgi:hypothetical protein